MPVNDTQRPYLIVREDTQSGMNFVRYPFEAELFSRQQGQKLNAEPKDLSDLDELPFR